MPEYKDLQGAAGLPPSVTEWIKQQCGGDWLIRQIRPLPGGISSAVYEVQLQRNEEHATWVLRQYTNQSWLDEPMSRQRSMRRTGMEWIHQAGSRPIQTAGIAVSHPSL